MAMLYVRSGTGRNYRRAGFTWPPEWVGIQEKDLGEGGKKAISDDPHLHVRTAKPASFEGKTPTPHDGSKELSALDAPEPSKPSTKKAEPPAKADAAKSEPAKS